MSIGIKAARGSKDNKNKHPERDLAIKKRKRDEAKVRNDAWGQLTPRQQLDALNERLNFAGAKKQRKKIQGKIDRAPAPDPIPEMTEAKRKKKAKERRAEEKEMGLRRWGG